MRVPGKAIGGGIGGLIVLIIVVLLGGNPGDFLNGDVSTNTPSNNDQANQLTNEENELSDFVSIVLADTEDAWNEIFNREGLGDYKEPTLVLFTDAVDSACGIAESAVGPFYCPEDQKAYIDLGFYRDLKDKYGAPGDFAQAYVIAHEVGHHVQNLLGTMGEVSREQQRAGQVEANQLSVKLELQADCFAGIWANNAQNTRNVLEQGDIEEGLNAVSSIGDDRLQRRSQGYVVPDSFTHGTSGQRADWFRTGFESGGIDSCNTFEATR